MPVSKHVRFAYAFAFALPLALAHPAAAAQQTRRPVEAPIPAQLRDGTAPAAVSTLDADETRRQLEDVLRAYPSTLPRSLRMDPTLLDNPGYMQPYPALANFLTQHPEIKHNPAYFLASYGDNNYGRLTPQDRAIDMWRNTIEGVTIGTVVLVVASGVLW